MIAAPDIQSQTYSRCSERHSYLVCSGVLRSLWHRHSLRGRNAKVDRADVSKREHRAATWRYSSCSIDISSPSENAWHSSSPSTPYGTTQESCGPGQYGCDCVDCSQHLAKGIQRDTYTSDVLVPHSTLAWGFSMHTKCASRS